MACRVADACDHAEHTAKPEIGVGFDRACSVIAFELPRISSDNSSRAADVATHQQLHARASEEYEPEPISRHVEWRPRRGMPSALGGTSGSKAGHYVCESGCRLRTVRNGAQGSRTLRLRHYGSGIR
jgi:hypothetical protein